MLIEKTFRFEASHQIYNHPGKCARLHGHSWVLKVAVEGLVNKTTGMVMDFYDLKQVVQPIVDRLDHQHLGNGSVEARYRSEGGTKGRMCFYLTSSLQDIPFDFLPTSENLCLWIADQFPRNFPWAYVSLDETCTSSALLTHEEWLRVSKIPYRKEANLDDEKGGKTEKAEEGRDEARLHEGQGKEGHEVTPQQ